MNSSKISKFMDLAGQNKNLSDSEDKKLRELGAQLLLSEVLEYVIKGLKVTPSFNGTKITDPNALNYESKTESTDRLEMIDGLADVAYTMYWNSEAFKLPLEEAFEMVCDNNLEKFVQIDSQSSEKNLEEQSLEKEDWDCGKNISWPSEVAEVEIIKNQEQFFAVGKDANGKVRKPSSYKSVDLTTLIK